MVKNTFSSPTFKTALAGGEGELYIASQAKGTSATVSHHAMADMTAKASAIPSKDSLGSFGKISANDVRGVAPRESLLQRTIRSGNVPRVSTLMAAVQTSL